ncbi:MAG: pyruvate dehydrogenase [Chloroflexi bacterium]|nr:pyruvate dehydrogenase [Chloroflexota bacterium]
MVQLRSLRAAAELVDVDERPVGPNPDRLATLESIQRRVLWLATRIVHEANNVRPNVDHAKVGGHQASSASVVSILTALYFAWLRSGDRVAVKPHASPAFHAVQYLLGNLDRRYLPKLRDFDGLQAYPSRTKDPDPVDISTGSVGLGSAATLFAALADRYAEAHFGASQHGPRRRYVALVGDAELDEGNVWEAITDATVATAKLGNVLWIVDLNRQSLDRVVPGIRAQELESLFSVAGWRVLEVKYGRRLKAAFAGRGGVALRRRVDDMANEEYQALVRLPGEAIRQQLVEGGAPSVREALAESIARVGDAELPGLLSDLGGHDLAELLTAFHAADGEVSHPTIIFAYTMKGWGLPIAGDPLNHSALLTQAQLDELRTELDVPADDDWAAFAPDSAEAELCRQAAEHVYPDGARPVRPRPAVSAEDVPTSLATRIPPSTSSQDAFGNALVELARLGGPLAERLVTASADVAVSTNLGGWINRQGVFATEPEPRPIDETPRLLRWQPGPHGQHIELGIAEINLFLLLGQLALSYELNGEALVPVGTVYDPFVCRGLDALIYGVYSGARFVFAGTPSGISLSPEGGAHQSQITPSIGMELPQIELFEPCFARETEWCLLEGLRQALDREHGLSTYLRLTTKLVDQSLLEPALRRYGEDELRRQVVAGGYRLIEPEGLEGAPRVLLASAGAMIPEAAAAIEELHAEGVAATLLNLTSASRLYHSWQGSLLRGVRAGRPASETHQLERMILPAERATPIITVLDGASHALAFLGGVFGQRVIPLGVDQFGRSGTRGAVYDYAGIDAAHIVSAAVAAVSAS